MTAPAKLYAIPGSHPVAAVEAALRLKDITYERIDLPPQVHKLIQRVRFGAPTVPGLELDGERIVGSQRILRRLDSLAPEPRLYPEDQAMRERVEAAERWADADLQSMVRALLWMFLNRSRSATTSYSAGANLPLPPFLTEPLAPSLTAFTARKYGTDDASVRARINQLPELLDHADQLARDGVIGGEQPNAADLQIGSSIRLLDTIEDLRPLLAGRPTTELARRLFPDYPGRVPTGAVPAAWIPAPAAPAPEPA